MCARNAVWYLLELVELLPQSGEIESGEILCCGGGDVGGVGGVALGRRVGNEQRVAAAGCHCQECDWARWLLEQEKIAAHLRALIFKRTVLPTPRPRHSAHPPIHSKRPSMPPLGAHKASRRKSSGTRGTQRVHRQLQKRHTV